MGPRSEGFHCGAQDDLYISRRRQHGEVLHAVIGQVRERIRSEIDFPEVGSRVGGGFPVLALEEAGISRRAGPSPVAAIFGRLSLEPEPFPLPGIGWQPDEPTP